MSRMITVSLIIFLSMLMEHSNGFTTTVTVKCRPRSQINPPAMMEDGDENPLNDVLEGVQKRFAIAQKSNARGSSIKQTIAEVIAGEYDEAAAKKEIEEAVASAPCVIFSWESSPSCKKALEALDMANVKAFKTVRLDDPWDEGNKLRAELGKMVGQSSVPAIFIGGDYVGGYDGGPTDTSPGIIQLAFQGKLQSKLQEAGAL